MQELTREQLLELFKKLPPDLKDAIFSTEITETLIAIGKKYNLLLDKISMLSSATNYVILGIVHPRDYIATLEKELGVDRETARSIANEVNGQIFSKIRESLKKIHDIRDETTISQAPAAPSRTPAKPEAKPMFTTPFAPTAKPAILVIPTPKPAEGFASIVKPQTAPSSPIVPLTQQKPSETLRHAFTPAMPPFSLQTKIEPKEDVQIAPKMTPVSAWPKTGLPQKEEINPHTFPRDIEPRGKDLKPPFIPAARPQGILEGVGIKKEIESPAFLSQRYTPPSAIPTQKTAIPEKPSLIIPAKPLLKEENKPKQAPQFSSPFIAKLGNDVFRQKPAESHDIQKAETSIATEKDANQTSTPKTPFSSKPVSYPSGNDPYRQPIDPKEALPKERPA